MPHRPARVLIHAARLVLVLLGSLMLQSSAGGQTLINGSSVPGQIAVPGEVDTWFFDVNAGDSFTVRASALVTSSFNPLLHVYDPNGALIGSSGTTLVATVGGVAAVSGSYSLTLRHHTISSGTTGTYEIHFVRAPGANEGGALPNGSSIAATLDVGDLDSYTFDLVAGESYRVQFAELPGATMTPTLHLYDPAGALLQSTSKSTVADLAGSATSTGTYTLMVSDSSCCSSGAWGSGPYELHFVRAPGANEGGLLISTVPVASFLDVGDLDSYTVDFAAGEVYLLRLAELSGAAMVPTLSLYDPTGVLEASSTLSEVASLNGVASATGTYTLVVSDTSCCSQGPDGSGPYDLHFLRLPGPSEFPALPASSESTETITLGDLDTYRLKLAAGESVVMTASEIGGSALAPTLTLYDPTGAAVVGQSNSTVAAIAATATTSGDYTLLVSDSSCCSTGPSGSGTYVLRTVTLPGANELGPLLDGALVADEIELGDIDTFTFLAEAGVGVSITMQESANVSLRPSIAVYSPTGQFLVAASDPSTATVAFTTQTAGLHSVAVRDGSSSAAGTGDYTLSLSGDVLPPATVPNILLPAASPSAPALTDAGGAPLLGPRIGDASEPLNVGLDCSGVAGSAFYLIQAYFALAPAPISTPFGLLHVSGSAFLTTSGLQAQSSVTWFPIPGGLELPNDTSLVGLAYAVQGFCGDFDGSGLLSNGLVQVVRL